MKEKTWILLEVATERSKISWNRLIKLVGLVQITQDMGLLSQEEVLPLLKIPRDIIQTNGGINMRKIDFDDPVAGALAAHAYAVLCRALLKIDPSWAQDIEQIEADFQGGPSQER